MPQRPRGQREDEKKEEEKKKKRFEPKPPLRHGRRKRKKGPSAAVKVPQGQLSHEIYNVSALRHVHAPCYAT
jgi:hypothetical protein